MSEEANKTVSTASTAPATNAPAAKVKGKIG